MASPDRPWPRTARRYARAMPPDAARPPGARRAAVVVNPTKHGVAKLKDAVRAAMAEHGWDEPLWFETTQADPGTGHATQAVRAGVDLVLACGGDGTVTACAEGVAGSGVPLGILAFGTGNLLARNLGLPLDLDRALVVALTGSDRRLDAGSANGHSFVVMAGLGLDAKMLGESSEPLKKRLGLAAYILSALRHLRDRPVRVSLVADGGPPQRLRASAVMIGNVGWLQGGVRLLPDAEPDDGILDAVVLTARGWGGWLRLTARVLLRRQAPGQMTAFRFRHLTITADREQPWELDGEVMGGARRLMIVIQPGRLLMRVPDRATG
jgi:YegS/Rv2252/BmrU family lipid kinase